jgi:hypothetical protein
MLKDILLNFNDSEFLIIDGFDDAVIGVDEYSISLIYSIKKSLQILMVKENFSYNEALDYFIFNIQPIGFDDQKIIWCYDLF